MYFFSRENIYKMTACLLAAGIDPKKCILFQQSMVGNHQVNSSVLLNPDTSSLKLQFISRSAGFPRSQDQDSHCSPLSNIRAA